jgi:hypothetical protein
MHAPRDRQAHVVEARREPLARARGVEAEARALRRSRDHRALDEALRIHDVVPAAIAQRAARFAQRAPLRRTEPAAAQASQVHRDGLVHRRMQAHEVRVGGLDGPCHVRVGPTRPHVRHGRQVMHHVAERGKLHEQDAW